jgi:hypothetical protein
MQITNTTAPQDSNDATVTVSDDYKRQVFSDFSSDLENHDNYIKDFDAYEAMLLGVTYDSVSRQTKNGLTDSATSTIYLERAARVVSQLPTGNITAAGKKDEGKSALMNIILQKWIYPNANSQMPFLQKLRSWQFYSSVYGYMLMHYDWNVTEDGYIGPDAWLWNPRNFVPPIGYSSIDDMPYANAISYVDEMDLQGYLDAPDSAGWDKPAIRRLLEGLQKNGKNAQGATPSNPDQKRDTYIKRQRQSGTENKIMLVTRFEAGEDGHWVTFAPDKNTSSTGKTSTPKDFLRDIPNPHKNGKIPFVKKSCIPTFDSFYDIGDFQRARPIQGAMDGLTNFYFMGIKRQLLPPLVVNPNGVVKHTVSQEANSVIVETIPDSIRELTTNGAGMNTYQNVMTQFKGQLLNQAGTTDTTVTSAGSLDPGFGKTPQALQSLQQRQGARDNQDLFYLETAVQTLINRMIGLIPVMGTETIPIDLFSDDVQDIINAGYDDLLQMLQVSSSGQSAKLHIKPDSLKNITYRFIMDDGSTIKQSKADQLTALQQFGTVMGSNQNLLTQLQEQGKVYDVALYAQLAGYLADIPEMSKLVRPMTQQEQQMLQQSQEAQKQPDTAMKIVANYRDLPVGAQAAALQQDGLPAPDVSQMPNTLPTSSVEGQKEIASSQISPLAPITVGAHTFTDPHLGNTAAQLHGMLQGNTVNAQ